MTHRFGYRLGDQEKDAPLTDQADLIEAPGARSKELEAQLSKPVKTSKNSHAPPSARQKSNVVPGKDEKQPRASRPGTSRRLSATPDRTVRQRASRCGHCGHDVPDRIRPVCHRYDHIDIPPVVPQITRIEPMGGRRACCARRFRTSPPEDMQAIAL